MLRVAKIALCLLFGFFASQAWAHDPGLSSANLVLHHDRIELVTTFAANDAKWLAPDRAKSTDVNSPEFRAVIAQAAVELWQVRSAGQICLPQQTRVAAAPGNNICVTQTFAAPAPGPLVLTTEVFDSLPPGHRQHATIVQDPDRLEVAKLLNTADREISFSLPTTARALIAPTAATATSADSVSFTDFLKLGIEHILTGYDHLLFLFAFLITAQGIKPILKIITSFTIAHSITLGLSALNIVYVPSRIIEPLIAATIVFVALQNVFRRDRIGERAALTFAFGLIHGFGFAAVLRDMGIASLGSSAWRALAGFNLGVETGQIAVAATVLPLLWLLRKWPISYRTWTPAVSALIAAAGIFWFIQRVSGA